MDSMHSTAGIFIREMGQHIAPPLVIGSAQLLHHARKLGNDVLGIARIRYEVEQLRVVHQGGACVLNGVPGVFRLAGLLLFPGVSLENEPRL
jgi:hypothetical protein